MPLEPGSRLDGFELLRPLGAGGMGEVWLAREVRLERQVALKLLPVELTQDATRIARFQQEARAASALSHPNVCHIYALGEAQDGQHYIAMEYVAGDTLRKRLGEPASPTVRFALDVAIQIASALSAAHSSGIVHRDIKPDNVVVRPDGVVKVLDFGLAKLAASGPALAGSHTTHTAVKTGAGTIVGTVAYMSPEQARGQDVDQRTDLWALGVVLYEMVAGRSPFAATTSSDVLAAILDRDPAPLARFSPQAPPELQRIITKALRKDHEQRYQSAKDLLNDLQALRDEFTSASGHAQLPGDKARSRSRRTRVWAASIASVLSLVGVLGGWWLMTQRRPSSPPASAFAPIRNLTRLTFAPGLQTTPALSPDGRFVAFASDQSGNFDIWVQAVKGGDAVRVTKSPDHDTEPDWSPDGTLLAFSRDGAMPGLFVVGPLGGGERGLTNFGVGPKWSPKGDVLVFTARAGSGTRLYVVGTDGAAPREILQKELEHYNILGVAWHPDGRVSVLGAKPEDAYVYLDTFPLAGGAAVRSAYPPDLLAQMADDVPRYVRRISWLGHGRALVGQDTTRGVDNLLLGRVDPTTLELRSIERLTSGAGQDRFPSVASDAQSLAFSNEIDSVSLYAFPLGAGPLTRLDQGRALTEPGRRPEMAALAHDGTRLVYTTSAVGTDRQELWLTQVDGGLNEQLASDDFFRWPPQWSPDDRQLAFGRVRQLRSGQSEVSLVVRDLASGQERVIHGPVSTGAYLPNDWRHDGGAVIGSMLESNQPAKIVEWSLSSGSEPATPRLLLADSKLNLWQAQYSPNGRWILFNAHPLDQTERSYIGVIPANGVPGTPSQLVVGPQATIDKPRWAPDGKTVFYFRNQDAAHLDVWSVPFDPDSGRVTGTARRVTAFSDPSLRVAPNAQTDEYAVSANRLVLPIERRTGHIWLLSNVDR